MRETLKIVMTKARLDDAEAVKSLLLPDQEYINPTTMFNEHHSGFSYVYEEDSCVGRYIASNGVIVMSFSVTGVTRQEAESIAYECERIAVWDMYEIRKAADRALGA
jgi:hypothetical protein